ncbi:hypothetical protein SAMN05444161_5149 [Rhizobiales bacterium GAS191]|jgi:hypothetical protein|nr:hypothetical protein SAMN05519103_04414 [Rhizobiales bacterium GAS113]SEE21502.1 hypothetical protein SAMN05444161_5149 [Rhizobiales bacterium GAS191]
MSAIAKEPASVQARDDLTAQGPESSGQDNPDQAHFDSDPKAQSKSVQREVARYIGQMSAELSSMARKSDFDLLAYFLEMARVEARALVRKFEHNASRPR